MHSEEGKIYISNLPNTTARKDILEYLQTAGPIKSYNFDECGQRLSATIIYYDQESAETAKKFLDQREFNTRKIKITIDKSKEANNQDHNTFYNKLWSLKNEDRRKLFKYLKNIRDQQGALFEEFLMGHPELVQALLKK